MHDFLPPPSTTQKSLRAGAAISNTQIMEAENYPQPTMHHQTIYSTIATAGVPANIAAAHALPLPVVPAASATAGNHKPKRRKEYVIQKHREAWTEAEHDVFEEALRTEGRNWKRIAELLPTKSVIQIRSHAQKHFLKLDKEGKHSEIPPARAKKRALHPYPKSRNGPSSKSSSYSWNKAHEEELMRKRMGDPNSVETAQPATAVMHVNGQAIQAAALTTPIGSSNAVLLHRNVSSNMQVLPPLSPVAKKQKRRSSQQHYQSSASKINDPDLSLTLTEDEHDGKDLSTSFSSGMDDPTEDLDETLSGEEDEDEPSAPSSPVQTNGQANLLTVLSSVSSLLPPASPLEKVQARQRAAAAREQQRKARMSLQVPSASPLNASPLPPTPLNHSLSASSHTPAGAFYKPLYSALAGGHTPFMSPSSARLTAEAPSPGLLMFTTPGFMRSVGKAEDAASGVNSSTEELEGLVPAKQLPGRLNFDEALQAEEIEEEKKDNTAAVDRTSSPTTARIPSVDDELWVRSSGAGTPAVDLVPGSASPTSQVEAAAPSSMSSTTSSRKSSALPSDLSTLATTSGEKPSSLARDTRKRRSGSAADGTAAFPPLDDREMKRARHATPSSDAFLPSSIASSVSVSASAGSDSPFTWLASDAETLHGGGEGSIRATPIPSAASGDAEMTPAGVVSDSDRERDWSGAGSASSFSLASGGSPYLRAQPAPHAKHPTPPAFEDGSGTFFESKQLEATPSKPSGGSFFSPMTPGPLGLNGMLSSPFSGMNSHQLYSPQSNTMHSFATPREFAYTHTTPDKTRAQATGNFSPVPAPFFHASPSA